MAILRRRKVKEPAVIPQHDDSVTIDMALVHMLWEDPAIYDGWSVAEMKDGTFVNRWPKSHRRHKAGQKYRDDIEAYVAEQITTRLAEMAA
jgi:hypothetical protein